jgi:hypothetical protein
MFRVQRSMFKVEFSTLLFVLLSSNCYSQDFQKEINTQVWAPFMESFSQRNTEAFMAVHSKDVSRAPRDSKKVLNYEQYKKQNVYYDSQSKSKQAIELRFLERMANENQAFEVGIYKTIYTNEKGETQSGYGKFHVALRKENGVWKILVDSDSSEGNTIGEKEFLAAKPMQ